jgi:hypothetical protein
LVLKNKGKNSPKQETLVFLETTVHRAREKAENQQKTRKKSTEAENQVFRWDFCAKKELCIHPLDADKKNKLSLLKAESEIQNQ